MTRNVGRLEWKIRVTIGIALLAIAFFVALPGYWDGALALLGAGFLLTGFLRYCPVNQLLGRRREEAR